MATLDASERFNFEGVCVLLLEQSEHTLEILLQMFYGFGARNCHKCTSVSEAKYAAERQTLDLIVMDPNLQEGDGLNFLRWLRGSESLANRTTPVLVASANGTVASVRAARDAGASFFIVKPMTPMVLMDRIMRVARDRRSFVVSDAYQGPDRRFKMEGPPPGIGPRRSTDITSRLGDATEPNLSQDDINSLFKPQKIVL